MKLELFGYSISINRELKEDTSIPDELKQAIEIIEKFGLKAKSTKNQQKSAQNATKIRSEKARAKITNAINLLRLENKSINCNSVAVVSGCSINTVKKYKEIIDKQ